MKDAGKLNARYVYLFVVLAAAVFFCIAIKDLFFFDEDIFVASGSSDFLQQVWQRSPAGKLSYKLDYYIWGKNPFGYHLTNVLLHLANTLLAVMLLKQLLKFISGNINSFQAAVVLFIFFILFLITPVHSEPLNYILARISLIVTFFSLLTLLFFLMANFKNLFFLTISLLCFLLALLSYEISWTIPLIILAIIIFTSFFHKIPVKKHSWVILIYFLLFAVWFIVKVVVIDKMEVSDYNDEELFSIGFGTMIKNGSILFLRNFIPPFKNSAVFLSAGVIFVLLLLAAIIKTYKDNRHVFYLSLLLILLTVFSFAATVIFGIDSHDSESERYIYFSSVFALMLLSVLITVVVKNKLALVTTVLILWSLYLFVLVKTIKGYNHAGNFAKSYLRQVDKNVQASQKLFFVNMPSQHKGALLFRAKSRMAGNFSDKISVMQEYLNYLYNKNNVCVTLSAKELKNVPEKIVVIQKPADSISIYFPQVNFNPASLSITFNINDTYTFEKGSTIIALKDSALYFFR